VRTKHKVTQLSSKNGGPKTAGLIKRKSKKKPGKSPLKTGKWTAQLKGVRWKKKKKGGGDRTKEGYTKKSGGGKGSHPKRTPEIGYKARNYSPEMGRLMGIGKEKKKKSKKTLGKGG